MGVCPQCAREREPQHRFCPQCGLAIGDIPTSQTDPLIGQLLADSYLVLEKVGEGGMGRVYRAEQRALRRTVAVKVIHPHLVADASMVSRFLNEARATSQLNHPNVVSVIDHGRTENGHPFIVMEYLRGLALDRVLAEDPEMSHPRVMDIVKQVLAALAEAHAAGIIHRDLKPANVILERTRSGRDFVKVLDFGLARLIEQAGRRLTAHGIVFGTPAYMSPEQATGGEIGVRSDLYSVGVILYELLAGRRPFEDEDPAVVMMMRVSGSPPHPRQLSDRPVPEPLAQIALRALSADPEDRYASADDFTLALEQADVQLGTESNRPTIPVPADSSACPTCGEIMSSKQKYCGECGHRVLTPVPLATVRITPPDMPQVGATSAPPRRRSTMIQLNVRGREDDLAWLQVVRLSHSVSLLGARLQADSGHGKTTLLKRFCAASHSAGDVVVEIAPDPWWAEPSAWGLRRAVRSLAALSETQQSAADWADAPLMARTGLKELFGLSSPQQLILGDDWARCVCEALRWAVGRATRGALTGRVVIAVDDLHKMDGVTRNAISDLFTNPPEASLLVVATQTPGSVPAWAGRTETRTLRGLTADAAREMLCGAGTRAAAWVHELGITTISPLHVEQLMRYRMEGGLCPPLGLSDLIGMRVEALPASARAVLQALAVLGDDARFDDLQAMLPWTQDFENSLASLAAANMIDRGAAGFRWRHPLIRELVGAGTPSAVRAELAERAAEIADERGWPIEVRAKYASLADHGVEAMFLSEQIADRAIARCDDLGAIAALSRGLESARREAARGALDRPLDAQLVFARKLGDVLLRAGRIVEADQLLRETLDQIGPHHPEGFRILRGLARVARAGHRSGEADQYLEQAIAQARSSDAHETVSELEELRRRWA
jgi:serine/threonine protein kinase